MSLIRVRLVVILIAVVLLVSRRLGLADWIPPIYSDVAIGIVVVIEGAALLLIGKLWYDAYAQWRNPSSDKEGHAYMWHLLERAGVPERWRRHVLLEMELYSACGRALFFWRSPRKGPQSKAGTGLAFAPMRESTYGGLFVALGFLALAETVLVHLGIDYVLSDGILKEVIRWVLLFGNLYLLVLLLGDYKLLWESRHWLADNGLHVELGARYRGFVPYASIAAVSTGSVESEEDQQAYRLPDSKKTEKQRLTGRVTPFDEPTLRIELEEAATFYGFFGFGEPMKLQYLNLFASEADQFAARLREGLPAS